MGKYKQNVRAGVGADVGAELIFFWGGDGGMGGVDTGGSGDGGDDGRSGTCGG